MTVPFTVLTAVRGSDVWLLARPYASLLAQADPDWRWVVEVDGPWDPSAVPAAVRTDARVDLAGSGYRMGVSAARNLALARVDSSWLVVLDGDDELSAGALCAYRALVTADATLAAITAGFRCVEEGTPGAVNLPVADAGRYGPGELPRHALALEMLPVKTQVVAYRADALRALGGWPGLPLCQDVAAFMSVALQHPVQVSHEVLYSYHRWRGQATDVRALREHDLMLRSRTFLAQQLAAALALQDGLPAAADTAPTIPTY